MGIALVNFQLLTWETVSRRTWGESKFVLKMQKLIQKTVVGTLWQPCECSIKLFNKTKNKKWSNDFFFLCMFFSSGYFVLYLFVLACCKSSSKIWWYLVDHSYFSVRHWKSDETCFLLIEFVNLGLLAIYWLLGRVSIYQ